jgi:hypothetical protein
LLTLISRIIDSFSTLFCLTLQVGKEVRATLRLGWDDQNHLSDYPKGLVKSEFPAPRSFSDKHSLAAHAIPPGKPMFAANRSKNLKDPGPPL